LAQQTEGERALGPPMDGWLCGFKHRWEGGENSHPHPRAGPYGVLGGNDRSKGKNSKRISAYGQPTRSTVLRRHSLESKNWGGGGMFGGGGGGVDKYCLFDLLRRPEVSQRNLCRAKKRKGGEGRVLRVLKPHLSVSPHQGYL